MTTFATRTPAEQETIRNAYEFERNACEQGSSADNPFYAQVLAMQDGAEVWDGISEALTMYFRKG